MKENYFDFDDTSSGQNCIPSHIAQAAARLAIPLDSAQAFEILISGIRNQARVLRMMCISLDELGLSETGKARARSGIDVARWQAESRRAGRFTIGLNGHRPSGAGVSRSSPAGRW